WEVLRRQVEERPEGAIDVTVRVRRERLDMFQRMVGALLTELPEDDGDDDWVTVRLSYPALRAVRQLLGFSDQVEILDPPEARAELLRAVGAVTALYQEAGRTGE